MQELLERIETIQEREIQQVLDAVLKRYEQLYPDWTVSTVSILRHADKDKQLDQMIRLLEALKA